MQKIPDASDAQRKGPSQQKEKAHSLSAVTSGATTSKFPLLLVEGLVATLKRHLELTFH